MQLTQALSDPAVLPRFRRSARRKLGLFCSIVWTLWLACLSPTRAAELTRSTNLGALEFQVAFISKILPYIVWPKESFGSPTAPFVIGLAGRDSFDGLLQKVLSESRVEGRGIEIRIVTEPAAATNCHILYFAPDQLPIWKEWKPAAIGRPLLTISADETGEFLQQGVLFNLLVSQRKLEINRANSERTNLKISSKLFRIARVK